jgi:hypothetical protein
MDDNTDVQEVHNGEIIDMRIEVMIKCILLERWDARDFDTLFNELVHEFVNPHVPPLNASLLGRQGEAPSNGMIGYLQLLKIEFAVTFPGTNHWPGAFDYMLDANCAISLHYPHDPDNATQYAPGRSINQAALNAVMQLAREKSLAIYNQGELRLN